MLTAQPVYTIRCMGHCMVLVNNGYILVFTSTCCKWAIAWGDYGVNERDPSWQVQASRFLNCLI